MCTRFLWNDNGHAVLVGRSADWPRPTEPLLLSFPVGHERDGGLIGATRVDSNPVRWRSRYSSLVTSFSGVVTVDGLNDAGVGAHLLYRGSTSLPRRSPKNPGLQIGLWAQYVLDLAGSVTEALTLLRGIDLVLVDVDRMPLTVHLVIEDASGDSAIIEWLDGRPVVHHGTRYRIMTDDPLYDEQLHVLDDTEMRRPAIDTPVPGNVKAPDRLRRATFYGELLREPVSEREAVSELLAVTRNVSVPLGSPFAEFGIFSTEYRTLMNLSLRRYYFELADSPNVLRADLDLLQPAADGRTLMFDPAIGDPNGNVSELFIPAAPLY